MALESECCVSGSYEYFPNTDTYRYIKKTGYLVKSPSKMGRWRRRWCKLVDMVTPDTVTGTPSRNVMLEYYTHCPQSSAASKMKGKIDLHSCIAVVSHDKKINGYSFVLNIIMANCMVHHMAASSEEEKLHWITAFNEFIFKNTFNSQNYFTKKRANSGSIYSDFLTSSTYVARTTPDVKYRSPSMRRESSVMAVDSDENTEKPDESGHYIVTRQDLHAQVSLELHYDYIPIDNLRTTMAGKQKNVARTLDSDSDQEPDYWNNSQDCLKMLSDEKQEDHLFQSQFNRLGTRRRSSSLGDIFSLDTNLQQFMLPHMDRAIFSRGWSLSSVEDEDEEDDYVSEGPGEPANLDSFSKDTFHTRSNPDVQAHNASLKKQMKRSTKKKLVKRASRQKGAMKQRSSGKISKPSLTAARTRRKPSTSASHLNKPPLPEKPSLPATRTPSPSPSASPEFPLPKLNKPPLPEKPSTITSPSASPEFPLSSLNKPPLLEKPSLPGSARRPSPSPSASPEFPLPSLNKPPLPEKPSTITPSPSPSASPGYPLSSLNKPRKPSLARTPSPSPPVSPGTRLNKPPLPEKSCLPGSARTPSPSPSTSPGTRLNKPPLFEKSSPPASSNKPPLNDSLLFKTRSLSPSVRPKSTLYIQEIKTKLTKMLSDSAMTPSDSKFQQPVHTQDTSKTVAKKTNQHKLLMAQIKACSASDIQPHIPIQRSANIKAWKQEAVKKALPKQKIMNHGILNSKVVGH